MKAYNFGHLVVQLHSFEENKEKVEFIFGRSGTLMLNYYLD